MLCNRTIEVESKMFKHIKLCTVHTCLFIITAGNDEKTLKWNSRQKANLGFICECESNLRGLEERSTIVRSHSGIDTFCLPWQWRAEDTAANVSCSKTFFLVNSVYTNDVLNARVHV